MYWFDAYFSISHFYWYKTYANGFYILNESLSSSLKSAVITLILFVVNALLTLWVMI